MKGFIHLTLPDQCAIEESQGRDSKRNLKADLLAFLFGINPNMELTHSRRITAGTMEGASRWLVQGFMLG